MKVNLPNKRKAGGVRVLLHQHIGGTRASTAYKYVTSFMVYDATPEKVQEIIIKALQAEARKP